MAEQTLIPLLLQRLAEEKQIDSAIAIAVEPESNWSGQWQYCSVNDMLNLPFTQRYDLALVNLLKEDLQDIEDQQLNQMLVRLRDLFAKKMLVLASPKFEKSLRALGLSQLTENDFNQQDVQIWQFNILNYKHVPDWFNSKFWANPDNWNKYRW